MLVICDTDNMKDVSFVTNVCKLFTNPLQFT